MCSVSGGGGALSALSALGDMSHLASQWWGVGYTELRNATPPPPPKEPQLPPTGWGGVGVGGGRG